MIQSPLFEEIRNYLTQAGTDKQIFLYVPYIKTSALEKLIDGIENKITIITNWSRKNLRSSSSDLTLYQFCKERKITLYNNEKIHLKVYSVNLENMILATGNISQHGLMQGGNVEMATFIEKISIKDRLFLEQIRSESTRINDEFYEERAKYLQENPPISPEEEPLTTPEPITKDEFLISALPMTRDISILKRAYDRLNQGLSPNNDQEISDCVYHDLSNYGIKLGHSQDEFLYLLKEKFFAHPFIQRIDQFLTPSGQFGQIKQWVQENCTDVPIPSRRELTGNVQVLFEWFEKLGDGKYKMDVPGEHSQRLCKEITEELTYENYSEETIRGKVIQGLSKTGRSITQIQNEIGRTYTGVQEQQENHDLPIWHNITEIVEFVAKELGIPDEIRLERYPSRPNDDYGPFYMLIVGHIRELRRTNKLVDWDYPRSGIWRLKENVTEIVGNPISKFQIGHLYHHDEIWKPLGIGFSGGIRASIKNKLVVLFWNAPSEDPQKEKDDAFGRVNIYEDYFDEKTGLYHYIGEGQSGDQTLDSGSGGNKRIVKAKEMGRTIHLFHQHEYNGKHEYLGEVELVGQETETQPGTDGNDRKVLVFLLKPV